MKLTPSQTAALALVQERGLATTGALRLPTVRKLAQLGLVTLEVEQHYHTGRTRAQSGWVTEWAARPV